MQTATYNRNELLRLYHSFMNMLQELSYEGSPQERKTQNLGGVSCYVVTPAGKYDHEKALILLTDIFSLTLTNNLVRVLL